MTLRELVNSIKNSIDLKQNRDIRHLSNILKNYDSNDWRQYRLINDFSYNKVLVDKTDDCDIYIITWKNYQASRIHNHSANGCLYKILEGRLMEEQYDRNLEFIGFKNLFEKNIGYIDNHMQYHKMINYTDEISVSLHIYSPPDHITEYYSLSSFPIIPPKKLPCN